MANWFYYNENNEKIQVTGKELKALAKEGLITPETIVETEEGKRARARKVKGLNFADTLSIEEDDIPPVTEETYDIAPPPTEPVSPLSVPVPPVEASPFTVPVPTEPSLSTTEKIRRFISTATKTLREKVSDITDRQWIDFAVFLALGLFLSVGINMLPFSILTVASWIMFLIFIPLVALVVFVPDERKKGIMRHKWFDFLALLLLVRYFIIPLGTSLMYGLGLFLIHEEYSAGTFSWTITRISSVGWLLLFAPVLIVISAFMAFVPDERRKNFMKRKWFKFGVMNLLTFILLSSLFGLFTSFLVVAMIGIMMAMPVIIAKIKQWLRANTKRLVEKNKQGKGLTRVAIVIIGLTILVAVSIVILIGSLVILIPTIVALIVIAIIATILFLNPNYMEKIDQWLSEISQPVIEWSKRWADETNEHKVSDGMETVKWCIFLGCLALITIQLFLLVFLFVRITGISGMRYHFMEDFLGCVYANLDSFLGHCYSF